ncbi:MAG TPA: type II toxin-antitoxin system Phd/YefM family antitoxin [Polyangia bacterium]|nr:type II toxin-antitoxin system Phd/YefM family antitoxin [Polyangia bacterium]
MSPPPSKRVRRWSVAQARARLPEVFAAAAHEPQAIFRHNEPAAVVVAPRDFVALEASRAARERETLADAFAALRRLAARPLALPRRRDALGMERRR